jgi:hypothetical protein
MHDATTSSLKELSLSTDAMHHEEAGAASTRDAEVRAALRKVDKRLLPLLALLYLLAFLDRGNSESPCTNVARTELIVLSAVGNARTLGMQKDLSLTDGQWNICLTIFFFPYSLFEVPSNMVLKVLKPNIWLSCLVVAWGTVTTLTGILQGYSGLLAARFFLGVTEVQYGAKCD